MSRIVGMPPGSGIRESRSAFCFHCSTALVSDSDVRWASLAIRRRFRASPEFHGSGRETCADDRQYRSARRVRFSMRRENLSRSRAPPGNIRVRSATIRVPSVEGRNRAANVRDGSPIFRARPAAVREDLSDRQKKKPHRCGLFPHGKGVKCGQAAFASGGRVLRAKRTPTDSRRASSPWLRPVTLSSA